MFSFRVFLASELDHFLDNRVFKYSCTGIIRNTIYIQRVEQRLFGGVYIPQDRMRNQL